MKDTRNYDVTNKLFSVLNEIKGFDVAMSNPKNGKLIMKYNGTSFIVEVSPLFNDTPEGNAADHSPFSEIVKCHQYIFNK